MTSKVESAYWQMKDNESYTTTCTASQKTYHSISTQKPDGTKSEHTSTKGDRTSSFSTRYDDSTLAMKTIRELLSECG